MAKSITCMPTGVSLGHQRYRDRLEAPTVKSWRCELTALSQLYNLYFVACNDVIHVYEPSFPNQAVSNEPALILHPPLSAPDLSHGIDYQDPHSITRVLVDYLGHDEVILATCDDGDVVGYRVQEIQRALHRRRISSTPGLDPSPDSNVKVFLHQNVGASAWGLAVHRQARMIAISANTYSVTVLAYALAEPGDSSPHPDFSDTMPPLTHEQTQDFPSPRRRDYVITLSASANVPAISFNNNGDDPTGRWIFSSSIDGKTMLWDLHAPQIPARVFQMGFCASAKHLKKAPQVPYGRCLCPRPDKIPHGAWGAVFLDLRAVQAPTSRESSTSHLHCFKNMDHQKKEFKENAHDMLSYFNHAYNYPISATDSSSDGDESSDSSAMELSEEVAAETDAAELVGSSEEDVGAEESADDSEQMSVTSEFIMQTETEQPSDVPPSVEAPPLGPVISVDAQSASVTTSEIVTISQSQLIPPSLVQIPESATVQGWGDDEEAEQSDDSDDFGDLSQTHTAQTGLAYIPIQPETNVPQAYLEFTTAATYKDEPNLHAPCLIVTKEEIFLVQRPLDSSCDYTDPVMSIRQPMRPGAWDPFLGSADRQCFFTQIPELGVFIVASPIGRVAIFSITKAQVGDSAEWAEGQLKYGFQLEYLLPFDRDDDRKVVSHAQPGARLIGVAVGPVQGMFDQSGDAEETSGMCRARRWRLLMYHTDHTVLSYELSKSKRGETPGVDELIV